MVDTPLHDPKLPGANVLREQGLLHAETPHRRGQEAVSQYVHLGTDEGEQMAFSLRPGWTASSWLLDDSRVQSAEMRSWLKMQQCALLHITLDTETGDLQRTLALRLARPQRRANRAYL